MICELGALQRQQRSKKDGETVSQKRKKNLGTKYSVPFNILMRTQNNQFDSIFTSSF